MDADERARLTAAYEATTYAVGSLSLRIGAPHRELDALLENRGLTHYAYLTAANPRSQPLSDAENHKRQRKLMLQLAEDGWQALQGVAKGDAGDWVEPSLLVLGIGPDDARAIGEACEQNAILVGELGGTPQLVFLR